MIWIAGWYLIMSAMTFGVYGLDKHKARVEKWRIKENTLHLLDLTGGWPGGFTAQRYFHHKWKKTSFMIVFYIIVAAHLIGWGVIIYLRCQ